MGGEPGYLHSYGVTDTLHQAYADAMYLVEGGAVPVAQVQGLRAGTGKPLPGVLVRVQRYGDEVEVIRSPISKAWERSDA